MVGQSTVAVGLARRGDPEPLHDRSITIPLVEVLRVEPAESSPAPPRRAGISNIKDREAADVASNTPDRPSDGVRLLPGLATAAFVVAVGGIALVSQGPPLALPADSPADVFSSARAMRHVEAIARKPHPLGSGRRGTRPRLYRRPS